MPDEPGATGDYETVGPLREGWGGTIREGRYRRTGLRVTIQDIRPDLARTAAFVDRLAEAGRSAAAVRDPHLLAVYDLADDDAGLHLVAEWSDAPTLAARLRRGRLPAEGAIAILDDVLAGLATLHRDGLVHGQVGPETIVVAEDGVAHLAELAVCAAATPGGSPAGDVRATARLGLHLLRRAGGRARAARRVLEAAVASPPGAAGLSDELRAAAAGSLGPGWRTPQRSPATSPPRRRRRGLAVTLVALAAVAVGVVTGMLLLGNRSELVGRPGPLQLGASTLSVSPASGGCDTTFAFVARGALTGAGTLVYRWEQSDGETTSNTSLPITVTEGSFQLTEAWRLQGSQTVDGAMTLHILDPVNRQLRQSFHYACP